ncbi:MAG: hypothetical protein JST53_04530 [Actinobacteria bacterium]|nr:hypothetical protein [Actinomycetota bacterium]
MVFKSFHNLGDQPSLPSTLEAILDAIAVPLPSATLRAIAAASLRDREVTAQAIGRVAAYEEESFRRRRDGTPRFSWVLDANGNAASPRIWARGTWRLSRRILTEDSVGNWTVTMAIFLASQMAEGDDWTREKLGKVALEATARVLGPIAVSGQGSPADWDGFKTDLAGHQHPIGPEAPTVEQTSAAIDLEGRGLTPYSLFFGVDDRMPKPSGELPSRLRLARSGEGIPFDQLVMRRAGEDPALGREVLAYIQEWGWLVDRLGHSPSFHQYAERWGTDLATVRRRNEEFATLFPGEETPERVWNLLWSGGEVKESFIRLMRRDVVEDEHAPSVINRFVDSLVFELREEPLLAKEVLGRVATFEESGAIDPGRELRRFFALAERTRIWSAQALVTAREPELAEGLLSIESVIEERSAAYVEQALRHYRRQMSEGPARELLLGAQKTLRVAATLEVMSPPESTSPYLQGVEWAAKTLALARHPELRAINLEGEARATVRVLDSLH